ncbi:hypothetical protein NHG25_03970 [Aerococcaceae bacterium NML191292]|nr:hypothetical protein [Aerococcaceae bacterium NML191292]
MKKLLTILCCLWVTFSTTAVLADNEVSVTDIIHLLEEKGMNIQSVNNEVIVEINVEHKGVTEKNLKVTHAKIIYDNQQVAKLAAERSFIKPNSADTAMKLVYYSETPETYFWKDTGNWHVSPLEQPITKLYPDYFSHLSAVMNILKKAEANELEVKIKENDDTYQVVIEDKKLDLFADFKDVYEINVSGLSKSELTQRLQIVVHKQEGRMEEVTFEISGENNLGKLKLQSTNVYKDWNTVQDSDIVHPDDEYKDGAGS